MENLKPCGLVRNHPPQLGLIGIIGHNAFSEAALPRARLRGQNMAGKSMVANHFAGPRLFEPLGRTLMGLQLWHKYPDWHELREVRLLYGLSLVSDDLFQCTTTKFVSRL
jgi:hypothetical protein